MLESKAKGPSLWLEWSMNPVLSWAPQTLELTLPPWWNLDKFLPFLGLVSHLL